VRSRTDATASATNNDHSPVVAVIRTTF